MSEDKGIRHRFTVPTADTAVEEWILMQSNLSFSIRTLIKESIRMYGMMDATCIDPSGRAQPVMNMPQTVPRKRGRPAGSRNAPRADNKITYADADYNTRMQQAQHMQTMPVQNIPQVQVVPPQAEPTLVSQAFTQETHNAEPIPIPQTKPTTAGSMMDMIKGGSNTGTTPAGKVDVAASMLDDFG